MTKEQFSAPLGVIVCYVLARGGILDILSPQLFHLCNEVYHIVTYIRSTTIMKSLSAETTFLSLQNVHVYVGISEEKTFCTFPTKCHKSPFLKRICIVDCILFYQYYLLERIWKLALSIY